MKTLTRKTLPYGHYPRTGYSGLYRHFPRPGVLHRISPTRDARFSADVVAIAPDVAGLITHVNVHDNQLVKKDQVLFTIDQPRYQKALAEAEADVAYYQVPAQEKRRKPVAVIASAYRRCPGKRSIRRTMSCRLYCINWLKPGRRAIWLNSIWNAPSFARLPTAG